MKLSKTFWIILVVAILIASSALLFTQYNTAVKNRTAAQASVASQEQLRDQLVTEKAGLNSQLTQLADSIKQWQARIVVLQDGLRQAQAGLAQAQSQLPTGVDSIDYDEVLLAFAYTSGLEVLSLDTSDADYVEIEGQEGFVATTFTIRVRGTVPGVLDMYNRIVSDFSFRTGEVGSVTLEVAVPVTEAKKAELAASFFAQLLAELQASFTAEEQVLLIEQAIMDLLGESSDHLTVTQMTERIREVMAVRFGQGVADKFAADIALALEREVANSLVGIVANIYGKAAGELFTEGEPELTPGFLGTLGPDIIEVLRTIPPSNIPGIVSSLIADKLDALIQTRVEAMVDQTEIARRVAAVVAESEKTTAYISVTVTAYPGGSNG